MGGCLSIRIRENVMKCINVKCEGKPAYDIVIESGFGGLSEAFNKLEITGRKLCIVTDSNVGPLYAEQVKNELEKTGNAVYVYTFAAGEENKTLDTVQDVYEYLIENHFTAFSATYQFRFLTCGRCWLYRWLFRWLCRWLWCWSIRNVIKFITIYKGIILSIICFK